MSKGIVTKVTGTLSLILLSLSEGYTQDIVADPVRLMFYNAENLFDTSDDPVTEDDEFLPRGLRRWNSARYRTKINSLYKTIIAAGEWEPPAMIGLCEIENRNILEDLIYSTGLTKFKYGILHKDSPDPRGIDVCLLYRKDIISVLAHRYFRPDLPDGTSFRTRDVLYVKCRLTDDTLHMFLNHWPSRRGGVLAGEELRQAIASMVRQKADSIASADGKDAAVIFAGDFNANPEDKIISSLSKDYKSGLSIVNLMESATQTPGTYRYKGTWEKIDQVLVSRSILEGKRSFAADTESVNIFKAEFLLKEDQNYPGQSPYSTYSGYRYQGGYSDHLPVLLDLRVRRSF